jgi:SAM-dependent methyltransferase
MIENTYGMKKRLDFVMQIISQFKPKRVLDMGCGTGANLTALLAKHFFNTQFIGIDSDRKSIEFSQRENAYSNLQFMLDEYLDSLGKFDLVIASEVIEHVEEPEAFLVCLKNCLTENGKIILTLPNGYGPFEVVSFIETVMQLSGIYSLLLTIKKKLCGVSMIIGSVDTLAISPHINFFSYQEIRKIIKNCGLEILKYQPRTFLCGFGFDQLLKGNKVINWNSNIANSLPPIMSSGWMFTLEVGGERNHAVYRRNAYARFRRYLNEKRWNLS